MKLETSHPRWARPLDRSRVRLFDWFPPLALFALSIPDFFHHGHALVVTIGLSVLLVAPLAFRRRYPLLVFAAILGVALVQWALKEQLTASNGVLVAFYTVASLKSARQTAVTAIALEAGVAVAIARFTPANGWLLAFVLLSGLVTAAGVLGVYTRTRAALLAQLRERADRVERERDQQIELASADERSRIARELHDVVAHHLTVMIALADGAAAVVSTAPDRAAEVMGTVSATGRKALADTRRLLGVLRADESDAQLNPLPGINRLEALLEQVRAAGLPATITITGRHQELSSALQLTIYRLVQEALTNTLKHAGPGARAHVRLSYTDGVVSVDIRDDGLGSAVRAAGQPEPAGHGLTGMRERVAAWDGELSAGPGSPRGWVVTAVLPIEPSDVAATIR